MVCLRLLLSQLHLMTDECNLGLRKALCYFQQLIFLIWAAVHNSLLRVDRKNILTLFYE